MIVERGSDAKAPRQEANLAHSTETRPMGLSGSSSKEEQGGLGGLLEPGALCRISWSACLDSVPPMVMVGSTDNAARSKGTHT